MTLPKLPQNREAEAGALSCILQAEQERAEEMVGSLTIDDFHSVDHQIIFSELREMMMDMQPLNSMGLAQWLSQRGKLDEVGGTNYLAELERESPSSHQFPVFFESCRRCRLQRAVLEWGSNPAAPVEILERAIADYNATEKPSPWPAVEDASAFISREVPEPPQLIHGVLHRGCKLAIGGGSKTFKTWNLLDLALAVSHGEPWLSFKTVQAPVCYVNLELHDWSVHSRIKAVAHAKNIESISRGRLQVWNLRGHAADYAEFLPALGKHLAGNEVGLLIIDPIYKLYGSADENSARDITNILNHLERLAQQTGAAVAIASHFSKGNQAGKEAIDRISGSGVFARDPDAILTFTKHETEGAFTVDCTLRNCKTVEPFVVRWDYPLMRRAEDLDPSKLKQAKGRPVSYKPADVLALLNGKKLSTSDWLKKAGAEIGLSKRTFYDLLKDLKRNPQVKQTKAGKWFLDSEADEPF